MTGTELPDIAAVPGRARRIAVVGASDDPRRPSHDVEVALGGHRPADVGS